MVLLGTEAILKVQHENYILCFEQKLPHFNFDPALIFKLTIEHQDGAIFNPAPKKVQGYCQFIKASRLFWMNINQQVCRSLNFI